MRGITYIMLMSIYSFNNTPYSSLGGVMTSDIKERTSISSAVCDCHYRNFFGSGSYFAFGYKIWSWQCAEGTILLFASVVVVLLVVTFFTTKERIKPPVNQKTPIKQDFKDIISNRPWKAMFALTLFLFVTLAMWGSSMSYYFNYVVNKDALFSFLRHFGLVADAGQTYGVNARFPERIWFDCF